MLPKWVLGVYDQDVSGLRSFWKLQRRPHFLALPDSGGCLHPLTFGPYLLLQNTSLCFCCHFPCSDFCPLISFLRGFLWLYCPPPPHNRDNLSIFKILDLIPSAKSFCHENNENNVHRFRVWFLLSAYRFGIVKWKDHKTNLCKSGAVCIYL